MTTKKKVKSYSMALDMIEYVKQYKLENNLSNESVALERILLEHKYKVINKNTEVTKPVASAPNENKDDAEADNDITDSINNIFDMME